MGFFEFFKKNKAKEEIKVERISVAELKPWLLSKKRQIEKQEESYLKLIDLRISQLIQELEQEIAVLRKINVDEKKAEEKIKLIVKENLHNYIDYVENLSDKLRGIRKEKGIIEKINSTFSDFKKRSSLSFEKSTFLIGKELASVKESIKDFFEDLEAILKENEKGIEESNVFYSAEKKMEKLGAVEKIKSEIEELFSEYNDKISQLKKEIKNKEQTIENIKNSQEFIKESKKIEELEKKKEELDKEIYKFKELIDFKSLTSFFHTFQKEMSIIKSYKDNFKDSFQRYNGEDILQLLKESKLQNVNMSKKIAEINEKKKEIASVIINKMGIEDLEVEKRKTESEIQALILGKLEKEKRYQNLDRNMKEIIDLIKGDLIKINVEISKDLNSQNPSLNNAKKEEN